MVLILGKTYLKWSVAWDLKHKNLSIHSIISSDFYHRHSQTDEQSSLFQICVNSIGNKFGEMSDDHLEKKMSKIKNHKYVKNWENASHNKARLTELKRFLSILIMQGQLEVFAIFIFFQIISKNSNFPKWSLTLNWTSLLCGQNLWSNILTGEVKVLRQKPDIDTRVGPSLKTRVGPN